MKQGYFFFLAIWIRADCDLQGWLDYSTTIATNPVESFLEEVCFLVLHFDLLGVLEDFVIFKQHVAAGALVG